MAGAILLFVIYLISTTESSPCIQKEFTATPKEVQNSCLSENMEKRWRGELGYDSTERYIELHWKKIIQNWACVKAMEFFVDGVKQKDVWGRHKETVRIDKIETFSLKVQVYYLTRGAPGRTCYGAPGECKCFEATTEINVLATNDASEEAPQPTIDIPELQNVNSFTQSKTFKPNFTPQKARKSRQFWHTEEINAGNDGTNEGNEGTNAGNGGTGVNNAGNAGNGGGINARKSTHPSSPLAVVSASEHLDIPLLAAAFAGGHLFL